MLGGMALYVTIAIVMGGLGAIYVPIDGALGARIDSTAVATFSFYGVAFQIIACVTLLTSDPSAALSWRRRPLRSK